MKNLIYIICIAGLFLPATLKATDGDAAGHKGPNAAIKKYISERIIPVLI